MPDFKPLTADEIAKLEALAADVDPLSWKTMTETEMRYELTVRDFKFIVEACVAMPRLLADWKRMHDDIGRLKLVLLVCRAHLVAAMEGLEQPKDFAFAVKMADETLREVTP